MRCTRPARGRWLKALPIAAFLAAAPAAGTPEAGPPPPSPAETAPATEADPAPAAAPVVEPKTSRPPAFPKMVLLDAGHVLSDPLRWHGREWGWLAASTASLAALSLADESLSDSARERGTDLGVVGDALEQLGGAGSFALLGGFYLAGAIRHDGKAKNVCLDGLSASLIASGIITPVLSTVIGRERPTAEEGAYSFHPFAGRSFPSGHTTQAFAVASVIATSYDQLWVKLTAYGAAAGTAWIRVQKGKHFPTDVVAGALIGTVVGRSVVHFNTRLRSGETEPERPGARLTVVPLVSGGAYGLSATLDF